MGKKLLTGLLAGFFMLCMVGISEASLIEVTSTGSFSNSNGKDDSFGSFLNSNGEYDSFFKTGTGTPTKLTFNSATSGVSFDTDNNMISDLCFAFGRLTYFNGTTDAGSAAKEVELKVSMDIVSMDTKYPLNISRDFIYTLSFGMTKNDGTDQENADFLSFPTKQPSNKFSFYGVDYTLVFTAFVKPDDKGFIPVPGDKFHIYEDIESSIQLLGQFTKCAVPVPGAIWLFGSGLAGLAVLRKRKK